MPTFSMKPPSASWQWKLQIRSAIIHHVSRNQPQSAASTSHSSFVNGKDDTTTESCSSFIQGKDDTTIEPLSAAERDYGNDDDRCLTFLIEKYNKHNHSCYGKTLRTVTQQIVLLAGTESHHYNHMNNKEHGGIRCRRSRMQKITFLHEKSIKTSDSFCKTHNEMMIQLQYIPAWEGKASLVPFVMQRCSWWEVAGGHVAGYTSGLY
jgi:hypothetical protein